MDNSLEFLFSEERLTEKTILLQELIYIYFRSDTLTQFLEIENIIQNNNNNIENTNLEEMNQIKYISKSLYSIHKFLRGKYKQITN